MLSRGGYRITLAGVITSIHLGGTIDGHAGVPDVQPSAHSLCVCIRVRVLAGVRAATATFVELPREKRCARDTCRYAAVPWTDNSD